MKICLFYFEGVQSVFYRFLKKRATMIPLIAPETSKSNGMPTVFSTKAAITLDKAPIIAASSNSSILSTLSSPERKEQ
jgi:hypothetical protein